MPMKALHGWSVRILLVLIRVQVVSESEHLMVKETGLETVINQKLIFISCTSKLSAKSTKDIHVSGSSNGCLTSQVMLLFNGKGKISKNF